MSTVVSVDFSQVSPTGTRPPRAAVADIVSLDENTYEEQAITERTVINLRRGHTFVRVSPGLYLIRLRSPTGQLLSKRVKVLDESDDTAIEFVPRQPHTDGTGSGEIASRLLVEAELPQSHRPKGAKPTESASRERWTARLIETDKRPATLNYLPGLPVLELVNPRQDFMGVAKLKARPPGDEFEQSSAKKNSLSSYLVGEIEAVQPARLYGEAGELHAGWKYALRKQSITGGVSQEGKEGRYFALSYRATSDFYPLQVACIPGRWLNQDGSLAPLRATYYNRRINQDIQRSLRIEIDDPEFGGLMDFMQEGDLGASMAIVDRSLDLLYEKWRNPYAAAAGAYVIVNAGLPRAWMNWPQWILNLATRFRGLPDGAISYATLLLQGPPDTQEQLRLVDQFSVFRTAMGACLEAVRRGPPLFRIGLKMMATNLEILLAEADTNDRQQRQLKFAMNYVRELAMRVDPNQPLCVFDAAE